MKIELNKQIVEVDDNMVEMVIALNEKGYTTQYCCEGHLEGKTILCVYISFDRVYTFTSVPKGFKLIKTKGKTVIEYILDTQDKQLKKIRRLDRLAQLNKWVRELPTRQD